MPSKTPYDYSYPTGLAPLPEFDVIELSALSREEILMRSESFHGMGEISAAKPGGNDLTRSA